MRKDVEQELQDSLWWTWEEKTRPGGTGAVSPPTAVLWQKPGLKHIKKQRTRYGDLTRQVQKVDSLKLTSLDSHISSQVGETSPPSVPQHKSQTVGWPPTPWRKTSLQIILDFKLRDSKLTFTLFSQLLVAPQMNLHNCSLSNVPSESLFFVFFWLCCFLTADKLSSSVLCSFLCHHVLKLHQEAKTKTNYSYICILSW